MLYITMLIMKNHKKWNISKKKKILLLCVVWIQYVVWFDMCLIVVCFVFFKCVFVFWGLCVSDVEWPKCWGLFNISGILWWPSSTMNIIAQQWPSLITHFVKCYQVGETNFLFFIFYLKILHEWLRMQCVLPLLLNFFFSSSYHLLLIFSASEVILDLLCFFLRTFVINSTSLSFSFYFLQLLITATPFFQVG